MEFQINPQTKIGRLLEVDHDLVVRTLIDLNKKFSKLKNPVLRNLLIKRVSIADACKISNTGIADFMQRMEQIGFQIEEETPADNKLPALTGSFRESASYLELDVRPILAQDRDPLKEIMVCIRKLGEGQGLKLVNTFEPLPLINLLAGKGFPCRVEHISADLVITYFSRDELAAKELLTTQLTEPTTDDGHFDQLLAGFGPDSVKYLDVRDLEMPKPMLAIMEHTRHLSPPDALFVYHKKIPVHLLPELEKQGLGYVFKTIGPGNVNMLIYPK